VQQWATAAAAASRLGGGAGGLEVPVAPTHHLQAIQEASSVLPHTGEEAGEGVFIRARTQVRRLRRGVLHPCCQAQVKRLGRGFASMLPSTGEEAEKGVASMAMCIYELWSLHLCLCAQAM